MAADYTPPAVPPHETLVTNFSTNAGLTGSYTLTSGNSGSAAAPAFSSTTSDPSQYLAEEAGQSATLVLPEELGVEIYVGSLDSYNTIAFSNGLTYTGDNLATLTGATDDGDQQAGSSNGLFYFLFLTPVTSVTFSSSSNSLEVAQVSSSFAVPEPSTWAMMMLGFAGLGFAGYRTSRKAVSIGA